MPGSEERSLLFRPKPAFAPRLSVTWRALTGNLRNVWPSALTWADTTILCAAVPHSPIPHGQNMLVWYSLAGMLSASVGAWVVAFAKFAWERLEHVLLPSSLERLPVRQGMHGALVRHLLRRLRMYRCHSSPARSLEWLSHSFLREK